VEREGMDWIALAQDRDRWRALVNEPSNSINWGEFLDQLYLLASEGGLCSMEIEFS